MTVITDETLDEAQRAAQDAADGTSGTGVGRNGIYEKQKGVIYDLLCAGPIEGLVGGLSGVYLNGTSLVDDSAESLSLLSKEGTCSASNSSTTISSVVDSNNTGLFTGLSTSDLSNNPRYVQIKGAGKSTTLSAAIYENQQRIVVADNSTFSTIQTRKVTGAITDIPVSIYDPIAHNIRIPGAAQDGGEYIGIITGFASDGSGTNNAAFIYPPIGKGVASGTSVKIDHVSQISSITNNNTCVLQNAPVTTNSSAEIKLGPALPTKTSSTGVAKLNYENAGAVVYPGTRYQPSHDIPGTEASASYMISPNHELKWHTSNDPSSGQSTYFVNASAFSFTQNTKEEVDRVVLALEFPGGLSNTTDEGKNRNAYAEFQIVLEYKVDANASDYTKILVAGKNYGGSDFTQSVPNWSQTYKTQKNTLYAEGGTRDSSNQTGIANGLITKVNQKVKFIKEFEIDLTPFQPLEDWRIGVKRLSPDSTADFTVDQHTFIGRTVLKTAEAIVEEKLRFPLSAYAIVGFTAEDFSSPPQRAYHIRGKKVKVPTNYFTREETGSNQAKYTRNKTTGADTSAYVTWDGTFRGDLESNTPLVNQSKVYTNNPAWIFYDILTDKEIGLGEFIDEADIDKYALYQIARHCDELVPDGKGGTEPRFSCNVYFKKQTEAYKVLKDLASAFRGMLYWIDGQLTSVQDTLKEPVYTFTNGNVEEGIFNYAYTGQQARTNQINVSWSNPDESYKQTVLTIEDTPNILSQDRIISKDVVAFGCTSEGQARRVGMWHLLTDTQETEILTFTTGINASFLRPGDFINVQDHHADSIIASGRLNAGTSTTAVVLDREIALTGYVSGSSHILYLVYPEPGVYLAQDAEATINGVVYKKGGLITADTDGNPITTASGAANLVDDSGNAVSAQFSKNTRIEKRYISNANGNSTSNITVSSAFSSTPDADVIWAIGPDEEYTNTDIRQFRIIAIAEEGQGEKYNISATEVAIDKYDGVDSHRKVVVPDYSTASNSEKEIPYPENVSVELVPAASPAIDAAETSIEALISWSNPTEDFVDTGGTTTSRDYRFANRFEIQHNFIEGNLPDSLSEIVVPASKNSVSIPNVTAGKYKIKIRTVSDSGAKSKWNSVNRTLTSPPPNLNRVSRIARGGTLTTSLDFDYTNGKLLFEEEDYSYIAPSSFVLGISSATTAQKEQSFNSMSNNTTAYLYYDHSAAPSDPWKAVQVHTDNVAQDTAGQLINFNYFKEVGATNNGLASTSGTVSITAGGTAVTGSSTSFTSDFSEGSLIKITTGSTVGTQVATTEYFEVAEVISNTLLYVQRSATRTFSGASAMKQSLNPDFGEDAILAVIQKGSTGTYAAEFFVNSRGKRGAGRWQIPVTSLPTTTAAAQTAWDTNWTNRPGSPVVGDQAIFFEGTEANQTAQGAWTYDGAAWQQQAEVIDGDLVVTGSITTDKIFANAITAEKIAANQITANEITTNSIQAIHVSADAINANHIAAGEITTAALAADAITADKIAAGAVTADSVAANSVVATLLDATSVTASDITTTSLSALSANLGSITAGTMRNTGANSIPDANSAPSGNEKGAFIDLNGGKFVFGSASKHILWDGTDLTLSGVVVDSTSTVNTSAGLGTVKEDGTADGTNITSLDFTTGLNVAVTGSEATISVDATTSTVAEGTRLYFTNARADARADVRIAASPINTLSDVSITSAAAGHLLIYDATNTVWENATLTAGSNVTITNADGGITIASTDTNTEYTAGTGLSLSGTTFSINSALTNLNDVTITNPANGHVLIYDETQGQTKFKNATLSAGNNVTITNSAGGITIASTDTNTEYTASTGLSLSGTAFSINSSLTNLNDVTVTSPAAGHVLIYDATNSIFENATLTAGSNVTITNADGAITIASTDTNTQYSAGTGLSLSGTTFSLASTISGNRTFSNNVTVSGDLTVSGTTTTINTANLVVEDNKILVNSAQTGTPASSVTAGLEVERGDSANKSFVFAESGVGESGNEAAGWTFGSERVQAGTFFGTFVGDVTGTPSSLSGLTTDNLSEGSSNLYFTEERVDDRVSNLLAAGSNISLTYNDSGNALTIAATDTNTFRTVSVDTNGDGSVNNTLGASETLVLKKGSNITLAEASGVVTISSTDTNTEYTAATQSADGLMSAADKTKLDGVDTGANNYSLPIATTSALGGFKVGSNLTINASTGVLDATDTNTTYSVGDGGLTQKNFTTALKNKLDGIATSANNYTLPTASSSTLGGIKVGTNLSIDGNGVLSSTDTNTNTVTSVGVSGSETTGTVTIAASGAASVSQSGSTITISATDTNTNTVTSVGTSGNETTGTVTIAASGAASVSQTGNTITISATDTNTDTNTFRTVSVDTNGDGSANNTLGASETLVLKKGSNITLAEDGGVVTISSTDTNTVYTHPNHSGDVTSTGDGATVIANNAVTAAKIAANAVGISELNVTDGSNGQALVTNGSGTLSFASISGETYTADESTLTLSAQNVFSVNASGSLFADILTVDTLDACHITASTIGARELTISSDSGGNNKMFFDGSNNRIVISDGT